MDEADLFQLRITEQEFRRRVVEVQQSRITARVALARQLLLPEGTVVAAAEEVLAPLDFEPAPLETYLAEALGRRPELAQAQAGLAARSALVEVARSGYFPKLFLGGEAAYRWAPGRERQPNPYISDPFRGGGVRAGFGFRQNLNFLQTRARVAQAEAERAEVEAQLTGAEQLIRFEVEQAYRDLVIARAALDAASESLTISREWLQFEYINFDLALGDTENLVKAVRESLTLEARYYEAVQRYNLAVLRLFRAAGTLASRLETGTLVE